MNSNLRSALRSLGALRALPCIALGAALTAVACSSPSATARRTPLANPATFAAPAPNAGVQMKTEAFEVPPNTEVQNCYFFQVSDLEAAAGMPTDQSLNVHRVEIVETAGSHHMNVFRVAGPATMLDPTMGAVRNSNGQGQCFNSANWANWPLVANTQEAGDLDWSYPAGVANELQPTEWLMLQVHYVNASTQQTPGGGQVAINFYTLPLAQVTAELGTLFATDQQIRICQSNPTPTFSQGCQIHSTAPVTIVGANGHFHSRGKQFDMFVWDGTSTTAPPDASRFYQSNDWSEPPMEHSPGLEMPVPANGGVWYTCSYQWQPPPQSIGCAGLNTLDEAKGTPADQTDCCYRFGGIVDENEHCNAFVYYYPKQDNVTCE
jgi:hypothetical protein